MHQSFGQISQSLKLERIESLKIYFAHQYSDADLASILESFKWDAEQAREHLMDRSFKE